MNFSKIALHFLQTIHVFNIFWVKVWIFVNEISILVLAELAIFHSI